MYSSWGAPHYSTYTKKSALVCYGECDTASQNTRAHLHLQSAITSSSSWITFCSTSCSPLLALRFSCTCSRFDSYYEQQKPKGLLGYSYNWLCFDRCFFFSPIGRLCRAACLGPLCEGWHPPTLKTRPPQGSHFPTAGNSNGSLNNSKM